MANIRQKRAAHAKRRAELKERKRERAANRAMLEAKGIDTSAAQHETVGKTFTNLPDGPLYMETEFPVTITITDDTSRITPERLMKLQKSELTRWATNHGMVVKSKTTKQQMVDHILASTKTAEAA